MTQIELLNAMKRLSQETLSDILLPVKVQKDGNKPWPRPVDVHLMRLPDSSQSKAQVPYVIHQVITSKHQQQSEGQSTSTVAVRSIFTVYNDNEEEGALSLLNLMERMRIALLKKCVIGNQFALDLSVGIETLIYPDDTHPYYAGEMLTNWSLPRIEREVSYERTNCRGGH